ncbi:MAG: Gfo/Idh/MocA family oxidoreductase, partial [Proteobacteria bacterium]|nr:Gfo/Idh/MocA family oxidoreductase [Pseudomonadota bacterium]
MAILTRIICGYGKARHDMTRDSTQNKTRIALIGCGAWGKHIARNLAELDVLAAICDTDSATAKAIAQSLNTPTLPLAEIEADASIQGVAIATPASSHAELAVRFLAAGK